MVTRQGTAKAALFKPSSLVHTRNCHVLLCFMNDSTQWRKKLRIDHKKFSKPFGVVIGNSSTDCGFDLPSFVARKVIPNRQAEREKCSGILKWPQRCRLMGIGLNVDHLKCGKSVGCVLIASEGSIKNITFSGVWDFLTSICSSRDKRSKHWYIGLMLEGQTLGVFWSSTWTQPGPRPKHAEEPKALQIPAPKWKCQNWENSHE